MPADCSWACASCGSGLGGAAVSRTIEFGHTGRVFDGEGRANRPAFPFAVATRFELNRWPFRIAATRVEISVIWGSSVWAWPLLFIRSRQWSTMAIVQGTRV